MALPHPALESASSLCESSVGPFLGRALGTSLPPLGPTSPHGHAGAQASTREPLGTHEDHGNHVICSLSPLVPSLSHFDTCVHDVRLPATPSCPPPAAQFPRALQGPVSLLPPSGNFCHALPSPGLLASGSPFCTPRNLFLPLGCHLAHCSRLFYCAVSSRAGHHSFRKTSNALSRSCCIKQA